MKNLLLNLKFLSYITTIFIANALYSQDYSRVDAIIKDYPISFLSTEKLATKINNDFTKQDEKVRAIFTWIALNVKYDLNAYNIISKNSTIAYSYKNEEEKILKQQKFLQDLATKTLQTKKGVCQNYAALFRTLCNLSNIECIDITGTSKTNLTHIGKLPRVSDHVWNAVRIGNSWRFIDVTWASGSVDSNTGKFVSRFNDGYFFTAPDIFFFNHFPDDKLLLMVAKTEEDFAALPLYYGGYINADYKIITPEKGIFPNKKSNTVAFKIIDLPANTRIGYVISNEKKLKEVNLIRNGNTSKFEVVLDENSRGYFTIYINNRSIVAYKIQG